MRVADLDHGMLLELDPEAGAIRFAGQRALMLDAVAMGVLRKYLVEGFGLNAARSVLTQFGFAHGWRMAEALETGLEWEGEDAWSQAGLRLFTLQGMFAVAPGGHDARSKEGTMLLTSFEAEQHVLHLGRSTEPACWTLCGLLSGYLSRTTGEEIFVLEDRCAARGDSACHLLGRRRSEWGEERADELQYFQQPHLAECLDVSLRRVVTTLRAAETKLSQHRRALIRMAADDSPDGIVAKSRTMRTLVDLTRRIASVDSTVIITGESGAGKERIARLLHEASPRATGPFIAVSCGAISETLLESELFGHVRGAFTGATHDRSGLFEAANHGTLLLDEIGEVSPGMQVKLLRVLQEREIRRVGENTPRPIDVRVVTATNRDLAEAIDSGSFREDLYYRIKVVELHVPPLRDRRADIVPLARVLLAQSAVRMSRPIRELSPGAADQLLRYTWPGNVRELENAMERAVALARGSRVELEDLPEDVRDARPWRVGPGDHVRPLSDVVKACILDALERNEGNQTHTAKQLGIGTATLYRKLKSYGLIPDRARRPEPAPPPTD